MNDNRPPEKLEWVSVDYDLPAIHPTLGRSATVLIWHPTDGADFAYLTTDERGVHLWRFYRGQMAYLHYATHWAYLPMANPDPMRGFIEKLQGQS